MCNLISLWIQDFPEGLRGLLENIIEQTACLKTNTKKHNRAVAAIVIAKFNVGLGKKKYEKQPEIQSDI